MMKNISMKSKMALVVSALFVVAFAVMALFTISYFEREFRKNIFSQQFALATSFAADLDDKLRIAQRALLAGSLRVSPDMADNADKAQRFLDNRSSLRSIFDNGIFLISRDGKLIAESPYLPDRRGRDISFRPFYNKTVASGKPHISSPYISTHNLGKPAVMLTVPIFDSHGELIAILTGSLNLVGNTLLPKGKDLQIGKTGYFYVFSEDRTLIVHPDKNRIMKSGAPPGVNKLFDRALAGFDGSGETVNSRGVRMLAAFKHLQTTNWVVAANYPTAEAYAPLRRAERYFVGATMAGTAVVLLIVWLLMQRLTLPLLIFTRHVDSLSERPNAQKTIEIDSGDEIGILAKAFNRMVNELDERQEALRESEERYKTLFQNSHAVMMLLDPETGTILDANAAAGCFYGYGQEGLTGKSLTEINILSPEDLLAEMKRASLGEDKPLFFRHRLADGRIRDVEVYSGPLCLKGKQLLFSVIHDISARKEAEAEIRRLNADLEHRVVERTREVEAANKELESFCYTVSHDLRAPLRGINGFCALLREDYEDRLGDAGREYLGRISAAAVRMGGLIDDLLELARVTRSELRFEMVDLSRLVRTMAEELQQLDPKRRVKFDIAEGLMANVDPQLMQVALENLLGNAWKFTGREPEAIIEFGVCRCEGETRYYMRDNGVGFDMSHAHKLFKPFQRLHAMIEFTGTGIGLASVQRIIQRHGGRIWAEAEPGKGACFYFTLAG